LSLVGEDFAGREEAANSVASVTNGAPPLGEGIDECWMDFDGARMRYLRAGSGPALILLHGLMGYSFSWRYAMPAVAPYRTAYAPDAFGAGFSDRPKIDHSMRATALRVLQFAENLGLSEFDLVGTSRGGAVAMCAAAECLARKDLRVRSLVLVAPVNPYSEQGRWLAAFAGSNVGAPLVKAVMEHMPFLYPFWHSRMFGDRRKVPAGSLDGYKAPLAKPGLFDHALSIVSTWGTDLQQLEALLPRLGRIPTSLMWGSKDPAVYFSSMEPLAKYFPNAEKVVFPGIGHLPYEECPQEFNQALVRFLNHQIGAKG